MSSSVPNSKREEQPDSSRPAEQDQSKSAERTPTTSASTGHSEEAVPLIDLLDRETTLPFAGLTDDTVGVYPDDVSTVGRCFTDSPRSFKTAIQALPRASEGELWATNDFVDADGTVDLAAISDVDGLDIDQLESLSGRTVADLAASAKSEPVVRVRDHKDIVDERRKALNALGYDVKFRWQIASDSYAIINPQAAYLPIINALQRRGDEDVFGWVSYRDWGGLLKMVVICPSLRHVVTDTDEDDLDLEDTETEGLSKSQADGDGELVVYGGFQTGYDFRGTQTLWARPILFFPESGTVIPDTGEKYTRRHYGRATDATHERKNDRVPINEWWRSIYDDIDLRMVDVDQAIRRTRAIAYDFEDLPFSLEDCYQYWGIAYKYAEIAAERATRLAPTATRPTVFNIQLSLLIALLNEYDGSLASNTYQEYLEVAGELYRKPSMMIQLALKEHDRGTDDEGEKVLPDNQQTLSDALEDLVDIPGIDVDTEADLSDHEAQRVQDRMQRTFDEINDN
jgi:hypothetical protein